jgi:hypothetical protein
MTMPGTSIVAPVAKPSSRARTLRSMGLGSQIRKSWDGSLEARGAHRAMLSSKAAAAGGVISEMDGPPSAFRCRSADQSLSRALER